MLRKNCKEGENTRGAPRSILAHIALISGNILESGSRGEQAEKLEQMFSGLKRYQASEYQGHIRDGVEVLSEVSGVSRLLYFPAREKQVDARAVFIIPSLVNGYQIFDVHQRKSFIEWMNERGFCVYVVDWGDIESACDVLSFDCLYNKVLFPFLDIAQEHHGEGLNVLGYCMGGTLQVVLAQHRPHLMKSCVFLAAPWDFKAGGQVLSEEIERQGQMFSAHLSQKRALPMDWLQILFAKVDPQSFMDKFVRFHDLDHETLEYELFVAVEDWLNQGYDLPHFVAHVALNEWYLNNSPQDGSWQVLGEVVKPESIEVPSLVLSASKDKLVQAYSSKVLSQQLSNCEYYCVPCGHISLMAGRRSEEVVWPLIEQWFVAR